MPHTEDIHKEHSVEQKSKTGQRPKQSRKAQDMVRWVDKRFQAMKENRGRVEDDFWDTADRLYRNDPAGEPQENWQANIVVPFVNSVILAILSEITENRMRYKVIPVTSADQQKAETIQAITDFTMDKGRWDDESFKRDLDKLLYGTSIWKEIYREDRRVLRKRIFNKETGKDEVETKDIKEFNDVYGKHVPIRDFYLDDKATDIREARDCVERQIMDINDFKTRWSKYKTSKKVKKWGFLKPSISEKKIHDIPSGGNLNRENEFIPVSDIKNNEVEILEYWNRPKDMHVIVANGILVVEEPIPYDHKQLPYAMDIAIPMPNSAYGQGIPRMLEGVQEELNTLHNQMLDETHLSIHKPILMGGMTILDEDEYQLRPKAIIPVDDVGQTRELQMTGVTANHFQMFEEVKQTGRIAAGLDVRFAEGVSPKGTETATEIIRLQESSLRRIGLLVKMLKIKCLPRIGMLRTSNIQQFYKDPLRVELITNDGNQIQLNEKSGKAKFKKTNRTIRTQKEGSDEFDFREITSEDVRGNFDTQVISQSTRPPDAAVLAKRLNTALQTVLAFPPALEIVDIEALFKHFFKSIDLPTSIVKDTLRESEESDFELANEENVDMANGQTIPPTSNPSLKHTAIHAAFMFQIDQNGRPTGQETERFQNLSQKKRGSFLDHYQGELDQQAAKGNVSAQAVARTPNQSRGMGTQEVGGGQEVETPEI